MLGFDIAAALPELRAQAASMHVAVCDIERQATGWDEALKKSVTTWAPVHMDVPCAVVGPPVSSRSMLADEAVTAQGVQVKVSHDLAATHRA